MAERGSTFRLSRVRVAYNGRTAVAVEDLEIAAGERVAFVGPSGAGKTTLLRTMAASLLPSTGAVEIDGRHVEKLSAGELRSVRATIGFVHQDLRLVPNVAVLQNVLSGKLGKLGVLGSLRAMVLPKRADVEAAYRILERLGVGEKLYERTDRLSGGQRQRVAIARALFQDPSSLFADEPVSSVDPARARALVELLTAVAAERGLTLCVSLHNLTLAREMFPRIVGLREGRVVFDGPPDSIDEAQFGELFRLHGADGEVAALG